MAKKLAPQEPIPQIEQEQRNVPSVDTITGVMMSQYPKQDLPNTDVCKKIGEVFKKLSEAHEAYSQAAKGLAQLASEVSPEHFTLLLTASTMSVIQVVVLPTMNLPVVAPRRCQSQQLQPKNVQWLLTSPRLKFYQTRILQPL